MRGGRVLRAGASLFLLVKDVRPFLHAIMETVGDVVLGPTLRAVWMDIETYAGGSRTLHLHGESGTGKELAARLYHRAGPMYKGPFIAVNCAAIPTGLAESLLFGARRGAFTGADRTSDGYLVAADGGVVFLDEVSELSLDVQAKLLRVLETGEVLALGAQASRRIDVHICSATLRDLRALTASGAFRQDLYFRIARPTVTIPALRDRPEEIPSLAQLFARRVGADVYLDPLFVEMLACRSWPGNVRELATESAHAAQRASAAGRKLVTPQDLSPTAGCELRVSEPVPRTVDSVADEEILATLRSHQGNVTAAARALGLHRNQLRRWVHSHGIAVRDMR